VPSVLAEWITCELSVNRTQHLRNALEYGLDDTAPFFLESSCSKPPAETGCRPRCCAIPPVTKPKA